ncbi:LysR family transcriptional regulator [Kitasatospora sp. NPDC096147]|uniref:LysR family transcriptional regulator n=1 Tax=Kitasatospora sp. NPDC096147 TaxID=3364093 RepID=UPI003819D8F9
MELRQLRVFEAVVRHRTVTEAAHALGLAPSTVSEHVRGLERSLGLLLFERGSRGMRLTPAGERLRGWAHRLLDQADQARREVLGAEQALRLGALETIAASHVPGVLGRVGARDPRLRIELRPSRSRDELLTDLAAGRLDAALLLDTGTALGGLGFGPPPAGLSFADVATVPLLLVGRPGHPLAGHRALGAEDLTGEQLLANAPGCSFLLAADRLLSPTQPRLRADGVPLMRAWAEQGLGVALLPEFAVAAAVADGRLAVLPLSRPAPPSLSLRLVWRTGTEDAPGVRTLLYAAADPGAAR